MIEKSCAFTGHRPSRFAFGFDEEDEKCLRLKLAMEAQIVRMADAGITTFYTGMALGTDQWAAQIVLRRKLDFPSIQLIAVLPCETQANKWSPEQREQYFNTLAKCDDVITLNTHYTPSCMFERNRWLVDHAGFLLAVYDGGTKGGTAYTVGYARQKRRDIIAIHPDTLLVMDNAELTALELRRQLRILPGRDQ